MRSFGGVAIGAVTAVDGSTLTVESTGPDDATTTRTVTVTDATTYTTTVDGRRLGDRRRPVRQRPRRGRRQRQGDGDEHHGVRADRRGVLCRDGPALRWRSRRRPAGLHAGRWHRCLSSQPARPSRVGNAPAAVASSRSATAGAVVLVAAGGGVALAVGGSDDGRYRTATAERAGVEQVIDTVGTIASASRRDASFSVDGTVATVAVTVGQVVAAGDVLATLDTEALQDAVEKAQADLADAQQQLSDDLDTQTSGSTSSSSTSSSSTPSSSDHPVRVTVGVHGVGGPRGRRLPRRLHGPCGRACGGRGALGAAGAPRPVPADRRRPGRQQRERHGLAGDVRGVPRRRRRRRRDA